MDAAIFDLITRGFSLPAGQRLAVREEGALGDVWKFEDGAVVFGLSEARQLIEQREPVGASERLARLRIIPTVH